MNPELYDHERDVSVSWRRENLTNFQPSLSLLFYCKRFGDVPPTDCQAHAKIFSGTPLTPKELEDLGEAPFGGKRGPIITINEADDAEETNCITPEVFTLMWEFGLSDVEKVEWLDICIAIAGEHRKSSAIG